MKPSPLLLKAGLVVGLGALSLGSGKSASAMMMNNCRYLVPGIHVCPTDPEDVCQLYGCPISGASCLVNGEPYETYYIDCLGGET